MKRVLGGIDTISEWSGKVVSIAAPVIMCLLIFEVTLRYVFNAPTIWAHETSQHFFGALTILVGAYVLLHGLHIRVDVIYMRFSPRARAILDSVTFLCFFLYVIVMLVHGWEIALRSVGAMETTKTPFGSPLWPLRLTVPIGVFLILLQGLAQWIRTLHMAVTGRELVG